MSSSPRCLLHEPNLLLLDEPTNFLDLRTQILLEHFLQELPLGLPDRLARSGLPRCHLRLTRSICSRGKLTIVPRQGRCLPGIQKEQRDCATNAPTPPIMAKRKHLEDVHRPEQGPGRDGDAGAIEEQAAREAGTRRRSSATNRPPTSARRRSSRARAPPCAAAIWPSATPTGRSPRDIQLEIDHGSRAAIVGDNGQGKTTFLRTHRRFAASRSPAK